MDWQVILTLFGSFGVLLFLGLPVSFAIGLSSLLTIAMTLPLDTAITVVAQRMAVGMDNFALLYSRLDHINCYNLSFLIISFLCLLSFFLNSPFV